MNLSQRHIRLSPLHTKGVLTLSLVIFAESVTFANGMNFWSKFQKVDDRFFQNEGKSFKSQNKNPFFSLKGKEAEECTLNAESEKAFKIGSSSTPLLSKLFQKNFRKSTRNAAILSLDDDSCCHSCYNCMDPKTVDKMCGIPRGGHVHSHSHEHVRDAAAAAADAVTPYNIPLNAWKVIFQAFLTAMNVFCWMVPLRSKKISSNKLGLSLANAFSGGVFLSLAFGHLIPECIHGFDPAIYNEATPFMIVLAGYLLIFFVEKVAFDAHDILHEMEGGSGHGHSHSHEHAAASTETKPAANGEAAAPATAGSGRSAVILLGALAVHSILEMMALGLADSFGDCALLTLSISLHQPAESIALLVAFLKSGMPEAQIIRFLSVFSCMGPIGVLLGMLVNEYAAPIVDSIMLAVVAGTFVYVGATEVIPEEWEDSEHKWKKFAALMSGIVSIFAITQYTMTLGAH